MSRSAVVFPSSHDCYYSFTRKWRANSCCTFSLKHARSTEGTEKAENEGVLAVTVNIIRHSSCGINVAHVGGQSRGETGEEKTEGDGHRERRNI